MIVAIWVRACIHLRASILQLVCGDLDFFEKVLSLARDEPNVKFP
jgi:hypothetical protein